MNADVLKEIVQESLVRFAAIPTEKWYYKPLPEKWSKKEILGHLIDSAMTNLRRFIVTQYTQNQHIVYNQNEWVASQQYQSADLADLVALWKILNSQIARTIEILPEEKRHFTCDTGKTAPELHSIEWLFEDYITHLRHHLNQIFA